MICLTGSAAEPAGATGRWVMEAPPCANLVVETVHREASHEVAVGVVGPLPVVRHESFGVE